MIATTQPIQLGTVTAAETTVSLTLISQPTPSGVKVSAVVIGQRFHRAEGDVCTPVGLPIRVNVADVYALAQSNPAVAVDVVAIQEALGRLVPHLGL